jgi:hypothetical protein
LTKDFNVVNSSYAESVESVPTTKRVCPISLRLGHRTVIHLATSTVAIFFFNSVDFMPLHSIICNLKFTPAIYRR